MIFLSKRQFLKAFFAFTISLPYVSYSKGNLKSNLTNKKENKMSITLPDLPYAQDALEPHISSKTLSFHYGKHHNAYVTNLNKLIEGTEHENASLEDIIKNSEGGVFNNAAQVWNHTFYWNSMKPNGGGNPEGELANKINQAFGSFDKFKEEFANAAATQFGSGWAWLVLDGDELKIVKTANAETPLTNGQIPLLTIDVWEHAYYLDFQNKRPDYIQTFLNNLANWEFAAENLDNATNAKAA
jgi:Fe-Mn family superoxide dismutase